MTYTDQEKNCIGRIIHLKLIFSVACPLTSDFTTISVRIGR